MTTGGNKVKQSIITVNRQQFISNLFLFVSVQISYDLLQSENKRDLPYGLSTDNVALSMAYTVG